MEKEDKTLLCIPEELIKLILGETLSLEDWSSLLLTCGDLKRIVENYPDYRFATLCMRSFQHNKEATTSTAATFEGERLFGNGLSLSGIQIKQTRLNNLLPHAFALNRADLPEALKVEDRDVAEKNVPEGQALDKEVWWLPGKPDDQILVPTYRTFSSWEECYLQHLQASDELDALIEKLKQNPYYPSKSTISSLCERVTTILAEEPNVLPLEPPVIIFGDTHGHWASSMEIFKSVGYPGDMEEGPDGKKRMKQFLFLGDLICRGTHDIPWILLLFAWKIKYPNCVHLLRGTQEDTMVSQTYGFKDHSELHYGDDEVFEMVNHVFLSLPLAALIGEKYFAVHGGLSPLVTKVNEIQCLDRFVNMPHEGPMCDILWSDPDDIEGWGLSPRGAGYLFGPSISRDFTEANNLEAIIRAHQLVTEGFMSTHDGKVITVFSAANYCYNCGNQGGVLLIDQDLQWNGRSFDSVPEPQGQFED